jgi:hypothetical protein
VITSTEKAVRLDSGTQILLTALPEGTQTSSQY